jgi:hypothetical protein
MIETARRARRQAIAILRALLHDDRATIRTLAHEVGGTGDSYAALLALARDILAAHTEPDRLLDRLEAALDSFNSEKSARQWRPVP